MLDGVINVEWLDIMDKIDENMEVIHDNDDSNENGDNLSSPRNNSGNGGGDDANEGDGGDDDDEENGEQFLNDQYEEIST